MEMEMEMEMEMKVYTYLRYVEQVGRYELLYSTVHRYIFMHMVG